LIQEGKGTSMATKAQAVEAAKRIGLILQDEGDAMSVFFQRGKHDGNGTHELVTVLDRYQSKAQAWDAVLDDINTQWVDCHIADCEWCS
jgi:hypothetical protein